MENMWSLSLQQRITKIRHSLLIYYIAQILIKTCLGSKHKSLAKYNEDKGPHKDKEVEERVTI